MYALAHATGRTGRFTLTERWRNNERLLAPQEHPLKVIHIYSEIFVILFRKTIIFKIRISILNKKQKF